MSAYIKICLNLVQCNRDRYIHDGIYLTQYFWGCRDLTCCWSSQGQNCFEIDVCWFNILQGCTGNCVHHALDLLQLSTLEGVWLLKVLHLFKLQFLNFRDFFVGTDSRIFPFYLDCLGALVRE